MPVIQTRYRDIPWEEFSKAIGTSSSMTPESWSMARGRDIHVETPPEVGSDSFACCEGGPVYRVVGKFADNRTVTGKERYRCVCPHIAEIGD